LGKVPNYKVQIPNNYQIPISKPIVTDDFSQLAAYLAIDCWLLPACRRGREFVHISGI